MEDEFQAGSSVALPPTTIQRAVSKPEETNDEVLTEFTFITLALICLRLQ